MSDTYVILGRIGRVAVITLNRPERKNAMNEAMWDRFEAVASELAANLPRAVVVTGAGESFCAGFDVNPDNPQVSGLIDAVMKHTRSPVEALIRRIRRAVDSFASLPVPLIAAINGLAYGGGAELASRCDLRVMDPRARICFSETRLGLMPDWGGCVSLARIIGQSRAADLILTAREVSAAEAFQMGLVNKVSAQGKSQQEALTIAEIISINGPRAVRSALDVIRSAPGIPMSEALDREFERAVDLIVSGECYHGISAFLSKKDPDFPESE